MKPAKAHIKSHSLWLVVPQNHNELKGGWRLLPHGSDGLLFDIAPFATGVPVWILITLAKEAPPLDVLWIYQGEVSSIATMRGGCLQGYGDHVIEVKADWAVQHEVKIGDPVILEKTIRTH